jgi:Ca2+-dependent lipid-binding protein
MGIVTVYLDKISNLQDEDSQGKSDPYVVSVSNRTTMSSTRATARKSLPKKNDQPQVWRNV